MQGSPKPQGPSRPVRPASPSVGAGADARPRPAAAAGDPPDERRAAIEAAAYTLLLERGYRSTSMLAVAQAANASNETLYRWYGNKQGLFAAMVARNARQVRRDLEAALVGADADPAKALRRTGPRLLAMVTGERAVLLNRVAAAEADRSPALGAALAEAGRESVFPLVVRLIERIGRQGRLRVDDARAVASVYLDLLIGDLQVRRVTGALDPLPEAEVRRRAARAWRLLARLFGAA